MNIKITDALIEKQSGKAVIIDVRSPKEFEEDHIPGAISMPILDNEERHLVGWTYKKQSVEKAYELGWEIFHKKIEDFEAFVDSNNDKKIIFACARGGFRSGCFTEYFEKKRKGVFRLEQGYKGYRAYIREEVKKIMLPEKIFVMFGLTGSGKTLMVRKLKNSIDLEGLAQHRSSLFGAVGLSPVTQKKFETGLYFALKELQDKKAAYVIFEGESRKVGDAEIPKNIYDAILKGRMIKITCPVDVRAKRIMEEYFESDEKISEVKGIVPKMTRMMGHKKVDELTGMLENRKFFEFCKDMLLNYYDPLYNHTIKEFEFIHEISSEDLGLAVREVEDFCKN